jgi:hypothetical protein
MTSPRTLAFRDRGERPCDYVVDVVRRELDDFNARLARKKEEEGVATLLF